MKVLERFSNYDVNTLGEVFNIKRNKLLKRQVNTSGYERVELWNGGYGAKFLVHRLVAEKYIPNPEGKDTVNHIDGNKLNNEVGNLEWATRSENQKHAYKMGLQKGFKKSTPLSDSHKKALCGSRWKNEKHVYTINNKIFHTAKEAGDYFNVSKQTILNRCKSKNFHHYKKEVIWLTN